jgi:hypothetical protein
LPLSRIDVLGYAAREESTGVDLSIRECGEKSETRFSGFCGFSLAQPLNIDAAQLVSCNEPSMSPAICAACVALSSELALQIAE